MPTRKIGDNSCDSTWLRPRGNPCMHPEHNPPMLMVYEPGTWQHTCPACGRIQTFTVARGYYL